MKSSRSSRSSMTLSSPLIAATVGVLCLACYIQISYSAAIAVTTSTSTTTTTSKRPAKITSLKTLKTGKPRLEVQAAGRLKAADIKACISKAFCEVNSASDKPNYAVNQEFFDLMNQINSLSDEELDSGSTSVEYDDDDDDDEDASSEEASSERKGYPPPPPGYGRYGRNLLKNETVEGELSFGGNNTASQSDVTTAPKKVKDLKKKGKKGKRTNKKKLSQKYVNGTLISMPKRRRSRLETKEEKAEKDAYVTRKQREMGQVNDLAALIRISADIGLTLRSPRKCRTLFNKCTMSHEQIVDLFNQTLMAVTTPQSGTMSGTASTASMSQPTTKRVKTPTTAASMTTLDSEPISTIILDNNIIVRSTPAPTHTTVTTQSPSTTTSEDVNRSSKSRHEFSDEDVEYMTDTEIQPVQTYALFVNDAPEEAVKTQEEVSNVQETFKKYANAFPAEAPLPGNLPSLRKRSNKKSLKKSKNSGRSNQAKSILRRRTSSEEDEDDEEDDDPEASTSIENNKSDFRIEKPYPGYRVRDDEKHHDDEADVEDDDVEAESAEPVSTVKESSEGILPPLVQKERPTKMKEAEDDEDDEEEAESDESVDADETEGKGFGGVGTSSVGKVGKSQSSKKKKATSKPGKEVVAAEEEESSEEDEVEDEKADDEQAPPPWTPVYQMYMHEKTKQGHKKKQKGPYKGGEGPYADSSAAPHHDYSGHKHSGLGLGGLGSLTGSKKPWGGSSASNEVGAAPSSHSHEGIYNDAPYHQPHHGGPPGPFGGAPPLPGSQETGGASEQKPGFFQSILNWFSGGSSKPAPEAPSSHQVDGPYGGGPAAHLSFGSSGAPGGHSHNSYTPHSGSHEHKPHAGAGAPWPSQPDPAGVGHFGQSYRYRYKKPDSSEEESLEEVLEDEPIKPSKKNKKRRYNGRSDSIITAQPKKSTLQKKSSGTTKSGPPPPIVITPKENKASGKSASGASGDSGKSIQANGGNSSGNNKKKTTTSSNNEQKRTKKAVVKPKKKSQKPAERAQPHRGSRESAEDDDEAFSSEELYNQQVAKLKSGNGQSSSSPSSSSSSNGGNTGGGIHIVTLGPSAGTSPKKPTKTMSYSQTTPQKSQNNGNSFPSYFESMFGTEEKDKFKIKGKDDGSLLFGFDSLSSTLNASPLDLPAVAGAGIKKKPSSYKVNKNKNKKKQSTSPPIQFNNKEVLEDDKSSEEDDKKK